HEIPAYFLDRYRDSPAPGANSPQGAKRPHPRRGAAVALGGRPTPGGRQGGNMRRIRGAFIVVTTLALSGCVGGESSGSDDDRTEAELKSIPQHKNRRLCQKAGPGMMACQARVVTDDNGLVQPSATAGGLGPADLQSAYKLDTTLGAGATIAIVDAQDA